MSTCWSFWGHLGTIEIEDARFEGDPFVDPSSGSRSGDGPCILTHADQSKGAWLDEDGFAVSRLIINRLTIKTENQTGHHMNIGSCGSLEIGEFDFTQAGIKPFLSLRNIYDQAVNPLGGVGKVTISGAGTAPGALYKYAGWHPNTLPGKPQERYRIWFKGNDLENAGAPAYPNEFPDGWKQKTFDALSVGMVFDPLQ